MGQKKGQTGNPNGRPKGRPNKVTAKTRTWLSDLIDKNRRQIEKDLKELEPKDRLLILEKLMSYTVPKLSSTQANINIDNLSEEQIDLLIEQITQNLNSDDH